MSGFSEAMYVILVQRAHTSLAKYTHLKWCATKRNLCPAYTKSAWFTRESQEDLKYLQQLFSFLLWAFCELLIYFEVVRQLL